MLLNAFVTFLLIFVLARNCSGAYVHTGETGSSRGIDMSLYREWPTASDVNESSGPVKVPQTKGGMGMAGGMASSGMMAGYGPVFHALLNAHQLIQRSVAQTANGIDSSTTSSDPAVIKLIQLHVKQMQQLMEDCAKGTCSAQPRKGDPIFAAVYGNADKINLQVTNTADGVKVAETGSTGYAKQLIQVHAAVVSKFVQNGVTEVMQIHPAPSA